MKKTLIIKTGATGDVLRTTVLLPILEGEIYWLTSSYNEAILPPNVDGKKINIITNLDEPLIKSLSFDLVISLEEDAELAKFASNLQSEKLIGVYAEHDQLKYTQESAYWYDMSLISIYGSVRADELKKNNKLSYQEILYRMLGKTFTGEKYLIRDFRSKYKSHNLVIGLEQHAGSRWPNKKWFGYEELADELNAKGIPTIFFQKKQSLAEYITAIKSCSYIVTGDTLAMHIAMACEVPVTAIFNCTSPDEIYDYGVLQKVVSSKLMQFYYNTESIAEAREAVTVNEVLNSIPFYEDSQQAKNLLKK